MADVTHTFGMIIYLAELGHAMLYPMYPHVWSHVNGFQLTSQCKIIIIKQKRPWFSDILQTRGIRTGTSQIAMRTLWSLSHTCTDTSFFLYINDTAPNLPYIFFVCKRVVSDGTFPNLLLSSSSSLSSCDCRISMIIQVCNGLDEYFPNVACPVLCYYCYSSGVDKLRVTMHQVADAQCSIHSLKDDCDFQSLQGWNPKFHCAVTQSLMFAELAFRGSQMISSLTFSP